MDVLLTGADGFIGRYLVPQLRRPHRVFALSRSPGSAQGVERVCADLTDPHLERALPPRVDAVVALAQARDYRLFPEKALEVFEVNASALLRLLDWSRRVGVRRFVYASSANVYPRSAGPITEDDRPAPGAFYGRSKYVGELLVGSYAECFACTVLRLFTVYGPGQTNMLIPNLIERLHQGRAVQVEGLEGLRLSPVHVGDVCRVFEAVLDETVSAPYSVLNVGGEETLGVRGLAEVLARVMGTTARLELLGGPEPGGWVADCRRLRARFDLGPFVGLEQGLKETVDAYLRRVAA
jgi:nucleoside-diphosphate-sugar epimerase